MEWELVDTFDHGDNAMGEEYHYEAVIDEECPMCHEPITVKLNIWEYPVGAYNQQEIEVDGAEIIRACDISFFSPLGV